MIKQLEPVPVPDDFCYWTHPDLKPIDPLYNCDEERWYTDQEWEKLQIDGGIEIKLESHYYEDVPEIPDDACDDWSNWKPQPPTQDHFLICAYDTDDGIVLWWAKPRLPCEIVKSLGEIV